MAAASKGAGAPSSPGSTSQVAPPEAPAPEPAADGSNGNGKTFVSPVVARIASEHGVDPNQVSGTGRGGRVTKKDILAFVEQSPRQRLCRQSQLLQAPALLQPPHPQHP